MNLADWSVWVGIAAGVSGLPAWKYVVRPVRRFAKRVPVAIDAIDEMAILLRPNGGKSLGDRIRSIDEGTQLNWVRTDFFCDQLGMPFFECDAQGRNVRISANFTDQYGYAPAEMLGNNWISILHEDDRDRVLTQWSYAQRDRRIFQATYRMRTRAGVVLRVRATATPRFHRATGDLICWLGRLETVSNETPAVTA